MVVRRATKISTKKSVKVIEIVGILKVFLFTALDLMTIHGAVVMDFLFIQPFGWIRIIIACGRRIRVISIWSPHCEVCGDHNEMARAIVLTSCDKP
jgi:hypothetical protein